MSTINYDLKKIKALAFDVDGVLSADMIPLHISGEPMRSHAAGGYGCGRDVVEQVLKVHGKWMSDDAFGW